MSHGYKCNTNLKMSFSNRWSRFEIRRVCLTLQFWHSGIPLEENPGTNKIICQTLKKNVYQKNLSINNVLYQNFLKIKTFLWNCLRVYFFKDFFRNKISIITMCLWMIFKSKFFYYKTFSIETVWESIFLKKINKQFRFIFGCSFC